MVAYETYANALITKGLGHPLWEPDPGEYAPVGLGDVGYLDNGAFVKLFNASKDIHDWSNRLGLPRGHSPLHIGDILRPTPLPKAPDHISSEGVSEKGAGLSVTAGTLGQAGGGFSFECSLQQGALLIMGDVAYRENAVDKKRFSDYIIQHYRSWLDFAEVLGRDVSLSDLILVNGCDKTSEWACAAWSEKTQSVSLSFVAGAPGIAEGSAGLWGRWVSSQSLDKNVGPRPLAPTIGAAGTNPQLTLSESMSIDETSSLQATSSHSPMRSSSSNQCVFVRGFQMGERKNWFKRKKTRIDVGSGFVNVRKPSDSKKNSKESSIHLSPQQHLAFSEGGGSQPSSGSQAVAEVESPESKRAPSLGEYSSSDEEADIGTNECTPSEAMIGYIFENSSAELALVHDDDLGDLLKESSDRGVRDFSSWIRHLAPRVHLDDSVGMFKGTYDLRMGSDNQSSRNLYHHQSMPSSSEGHSPNIKAVSYHRFNRHPTGVGLDQLNTAANNQNSPESLQLTKMDVSLPASLKLPPYMLHHAENTAEQPNNDVPREEASVANGQSLRPSSGEYKMNVSEIPNGSLNITDTDRPGALRVQKKSGAPKGKGAVRAKSGCYTCRIRRKKCDEKPNEDGCCETCVRLRLECLGFGAKRPEWLKDNRNVTALRNRIKTHLAAQGMIKGYSSAGPRNVESQNSVLSLHSENPDTVGISSASTTPTLSITSSDDSRRPGLSISSMRDDAYYPSLPSFTSGLMPRIEESRPSSPYGQLSTKDWD